MSAPLYTFRYEAGAVDLDGNSVEGLLESFPEWIDDPNDRSRWRELNIPNSWFVYAAFPAKERGHRPIYIGMTNNLERRLLQHQRARWWWSEVDHFIVDLERSKRDAIDHEKRYIQVTSPCYNTQHYRGE